MGAGWALFLFFDPDVVVVATAVAVLSLTASLSFAPVPTADALRDAFVEGAGSAAAADLLDDVEGVDVNS